MNNVTELHAGDLQHQPPKPKRQTKKTQAAASAQANDRYKKARAELEGVPAPKLHAVPRRVWVHPVLTNCGVPQNFPGAVPRVLDDLERSGAELLLAEEGVLDTSDIALFAAAHLWQ